MSRYAPAYDLLNDTQVLQHEPVGTGAGRTHRPTAVGAFAREPCRHRGSTSDVRTVRRPYHAAGKAPGTSGTEG